MFFSHVILALTLYLWYWLMEVVAKRLLAIRLREPWDLNQQITLLHLSIFKKKLSLNVQIELITFNNVLSYNPRCNIKHV